MSDDGRHQGGQGRGTRGGKQRRLAAEVTEDRLSAWEKIYAEKGVSSIGATGNPPGYDEWATEKKRLAALFSRGGYRGSPDTHVSRATSVPATYDEYEHYSPGDPWENDAPHFEQQQPQYGQYQQPQQYTLAGGGSNNSTTAGSWGRPELVDAIVQSLIRSNDKSHDLATSVVQNDARRFESFNRRGKRRNRGGHRGHQQPVERGPDVRKTKLARLELTDDERKRHELRVKIKVQEFREGGKPPQFSNAELIVITAEQQALVDAELDRRFSQPARDTNDVASKLKAAGQQPGKAPEGINSEEDGEGEEEPLPPQPPKETVPAPEGQNDVNMEG